jgi:2-methylcitrate dehydratase PrpD
MSHLQETVKLAEHVVSLRYEQLPPELVTELKVLTLDYLGVAIRGSLTKGARLAAAYQRDYGAARGEATMIGHGWRATAQTVAFGNAIASHSIELDDVDDLAYFHFSPPVMSAALASAEAAAASGRDYLLAAAAGCEVMARLSLTMNPALRDRGFHTTPVCGVFGATAAAAVLKGLTAEQTASAFGIAGAHAGGLMEMYGPSEQKRLNPGPAAHNGIVAAGMAQRGFEGADTIFEGRRGVLRSFAGQTEATELTRALGSEFPVYVEYKPYACARPIHNAIDCALAVRSKLSGRPGAIETITAMTIRRHPDWCDYHQIPAPRTYHEAQVSLNHGVAVGLVEGTAFFDQFSADRIHHPEVQRLSRMLTFEPDASLPRGVSCLLQARLANGETVEAQVDYPKGSRQNPMTPDEHWAKFRALAGSRLSEARIEQIRAMVNTLETQPSIRPLLELTCS